MSVKSYDDGDGRWDIEVRCDICGVSSWQLEPGYLETRGWVFDEDEDGNERCPECRRAEKQDGRSSPD